LKIQHIREYFPKDTLIILLDDGSSKPIIDSIRDKVDVLFKERNHTNRTCCGVFNSAVSWLKKQSLKIEYIVFSEDDFLFWPAPITVSPEQSKGEGLLDPAVNINLPELVEESTPIELAMGLLRKYPTIHVAQISRPVKGNVHYLTNTCMPGWKILDHRKMVKYYYTNWPFMMRSAEFFELPIPVTGSIATLEASNCRWFDQRFGETSNYAVAPERPYYFHVGYPFSLQPVDERNSRRIRAFQDLQKLTRSNLEPLELNQMLCLEYLKGNLNFSLMDIKERDLQKVFQEKIGKIHG
jgi:hypothetical protein